MPLLRMNNKATKQSTTGDKVRGEQIGTFPQILNV